ncbi:MAG: MATE family efflux transporter [Candidatus Cloacimonetes bacterium]|jgi:putative MATE family efflux protein|nr:MATE family efflux transporter [Candidatus Cloacimonadota bacterium]
MKHLITNHPQFHAEEFKQVWKIAWPIILTNILQVTVGIADFKMVGVLGIESIAAVGMSRQVMMFIMILMIAISGGASVLVAHAYGAKDKAKVSRTAGRSVTFMILAALLVIMPLGLLFSKLILILLGAESQVVSLGFSYLRILFLGSIFSMFNFVITGILLGVGKTKVSLNLLLITNTLNIGFNYIFIFGVGPIPALGVKGAALGTVLSRFIGSFIGIWILFSKRFPIQIKLKDALTFDFPLLKKILFLGGPRSMQGIVRNFSRLFIFRIITLLPDSTRAISAYSVAMQVRMISSFIGLAFMNAAMSRVGQNMGAQKPEQAEKSGWLAAGMATGIMTFVAIIFFIFPEAIMSFFTDDVEAIQMGKTFFMIIAISEPVMAFAFAMGGALRGGGNPISPFIYSSISDLVVVIVCGYIMAITLNLGFAGIAIGIAVSSLTRAIPSTWKFKQGKWKKNRL